MGGIVMAVPMKKPGAAAGLREAEGGEASSQKPSRRDVEGGADRPADAELDPVCEGRRGEFVKWH